MLHTSEEICEALARHVEISGAECFGKSFVQNGRVVCTVYCLIGPNAQKFDDAVVEWLTQNGFKED